MNLPISKYLIIGSYAMGIRAAKDIDVICYEKDVNVPFDRKDDYCGFFNYNGFRIELLFVDKQRSLQILLNESTHKIASLEVLFAIKSAHITFPHRQWDKHIADYHILKSIVDPWDFIYLYDESKTTQYNFSKFVKLHKESTEERLGVQRLPKLKGVTKEKFFDDKVIKYYEHDDIHQWFAHKEKPMYTYMQPDSKLVDCSRDLWNKFTHQEQCQCVMEECYVIASERHLIPKIVADREGLIFRSTLSTPHEAFKWALMRVCTTLCSGWFRRFAIDNYFNILNNYNREYPNILKQNM